MLRLKAAEQRRRKRRTERLATERAQATAVRNAARIELLGATTDATWLASVGRSQAMLRSALAALDSSLSLLQRAVRAGGVRRRDASLVHAAIEACKPLVAALQPVTVCPHCRATMPDCQACDGMGTLTLALAAQCEPDLLHD
jgi:hypothetical protein